MTEFLGIHMSNTVGLKIWLPIVALVIAWWFSSKAICSLQKDKCYQYSEARHQELCLLLLGAYRKLVFLSFVLFFVSLELVSRFYLFPNPDKPEP